MTDVPRELINILQAKPTKEEDPDHPFKIPKNGDLWIITTKEERLL